MSNVAWGRTVLLGTENEDGTVTGVTTGTSMFIDVRDKGILCFVMRSAGTTSGGTVLIEEATWAQNTHPYSGTWSQIQSCSASDFTGTAQKFYHIVNAASHYVRVRVSSDITGGGSILSYLLSQSA